MSATVRASSGVSTSGSSLGIQETSGSPQVGDIRFIFVFANSSASITPPAGWTSLFNGVVGTRNLAVISKPWVAGVGTETVTLSASSQINAEVVTVTGHSTVATPQVTTNGSNTASTTATATGLTPNISDALNLVYGVFVYTTGASTVTLSAPSGTTQLRTTNPSTAAGYVSTTGSRPVTSTTALPDSTITTSASGAWAAVQLVVPSASTSTVGADTAPAAARAANTRGTASVVAPNGNPPGAIVRAAFTQGGGSVAASVGPPSEGYAANSGDTPNASDGSVVAVDRAVSPSETATTRDGAGLTAVIDNAPKNRAANLDGDTAAVSGGDAAATSTGFATVDSAYYQVTAALRPAVAATQAATIGNVAVSGGDTGPAAETSTSVDGAFHGIVATQTPAIGYVAGDQYRPPPPPVPLASQVLVRNYTITDGGFASNSVIVPVPNGTRTGDLLMVLWSASKEQTSIPPTPSGWTKVGASSPTGTGSNGRSTVWVRRAGTEPVTYTFPGARGGLVVTCLALSGVDLTAALTGPVWDAAFPRQVELPGLTGLTRGGLVIQMAAVLYGPAPTAWTWSGGSRKLVDGSGARYQRVTVGTQQVYADGPSAYAVATSSQTPDTYGDTTQAMSLFVPALPVSQVTPPAVTRSVDTDTATPLRPTGATAAAQAAPSLNTAAALPATGRAARGVTPAVASNLAAAIPRVASKPVTPAGATQSTAAALQPTAASPVTPAVNRNLALPLIPPDEAAFAAAITDVERVPTLAVRADWGRTGRFDHDLSDLTDLVDEITISREVSGELPAEVGLVEGHTAAALNLRIAGEWPAPDSDGITGPGSDGVDAVAAFAPYNPAAALYGAPTIGTPIEVDVGFRTASGPQSRRRFTGSVTRVNPSSADRDVTIDALDDANRLRAPITQPAVGLDAILAAQYGEQGYPARYNSQWLIDRCLRLNGIYASPPPEVADPFLSVTMHGSQVPEVGFGGVPQQTTLGAPLAVSAWTNADHPFGMLYSAPYAPYPAGFWYADETLTMGTKDGVGWAGWVRMPNYKANTVLWAIGFNVDPDTTVDPTQISPYHTIAFRILDGVPLMSVSTPKGGNRAVGPVSDYKIPTLPTWNFIACHWQFAAGQCNVTFVLNNYIYAGNYLPITVTARQWAPSISVQYQLEVGVTNMSWWRSANPPAAWVEDKRVVGYGWVSQADLDPGLNELTAIPAMSGENTGDVVNELVAAESARAGFSLDGRFSFRSRAVKRPRGTPERITADRDLADLVTVTDEAGIRNQISTTVTPQLVGGFEWVVRNTDPSTYSAGPGTTYFNVPLPDNVAYLDVERIFFFQTTDTWNAYSDTATYSQYLLVSVVNYFRQTQLVSPSLISLGVFRKTPGIITLAVYNNSGVTVLFKTPDVVDSQGNVTKGVPAFKIPGRRLVSYAGTSTVIEDPGSIATYGPRSFEISGGNSRWHQHSSAVEGICEGVLATVAQPVPVLGTVTVRHDPRRDLEDPVTLVDPEGLGEVTGTITGITTRLVDGEAVTDELSVRPLAAPGFGVLDDAQLGQIGRTLRFGA